MALYGSVQGYKGRRNCFDLSFAKTFDGDIGLIYPMMCEEVLPGDIWKCNNQVMVKFPILNFPVLQEFSVRTRYFFIPNRVLCLAFSNFSNDSPQSPRSPWNKNTATLDYSETPWEHFITGGKNGDDLISERTFGDAALGGAWTDEYLRSTFGKGTLFDIAGFVPAPASDSGSITLDNWKASYADLCIWKFFFCYNSVYNAYFRNENFQAERSPANFTTAQVNFGKDRFTAALAEQQRGVAPSISFDYDLPVGCMSAGSFVQCAQDMFPENIGVVSGGMSSIKDPSGKIALELSGFSGVATVGAFHSYSRMVQGQTALSKTTYPLIARSENAFSVSVADLRLMFQTQKYLEMNERVGYRYVEQLQARFGVRPQDSRIDRPLYLGGTSQSVIISQITSTGDKVTTGGTSGQLGQFRGNGISASFNKGVVLRAKEHGWIFAVVYVTPKAVYGQRTDPQWFKKTRYDYYLPEFAHLSEQPVYEREVWPFSPSPDEVFGFQGIYDEYRSKMDLVCGNFRQGGNLADYTCQRSWSTKPTLGGTFLRVPNYRNLFVSASADDPPLYFFCRNMNTVYRKMPKYATPGLIDHA